MNNNRRARLQEICEQLQSLMADLQEIQDEEQKAFDNLPENLQISGRGEAMEENISSMEDAYSSMEDACSSIEEIFDK